MSGKTDGISSLDLSRRLQTEYNLSNSAAQPVFLTSVEVNGGEAFSSEFFHKLIYPLAESSDYTLKTLVEKVDVVRERLLKTEVFRSVNATLLTDLIAGTPKDVIRYNKEELIPAKAMFDVESINMNGGDGFLTVNNEDTLNVNFNYLNNNFYGNAELVNIGVNYNPYKPNQHLIANAKFLANLNDPSLKFLIDVFNTHQNNSAWQHASEKAFGGLIGLQYTSRNNKVHTLTGLSLARRNIHDIEKGAASSLKKFRGDFLKSSIVTQMAFSNVYYLNTITKNFPVSGYNLVLSNELSSNQPQTNLDHQSFFARSTFSSNVYASLWNKNLTFHLANDLGAIYSASPDQVHVSDKFYLGGYNSFRGFSKNSINVNGGLQFYRLGLSLYAKVPTFFYSTHKHAATNRSSLEDGLGFEANPLRFYASGTVGNVSNNILEDKSYASSLGIGIKYINDWANFDIGYCLAQRNTGNSGISGASGASVTGPNGIKDGLQIAISIGGSNRTS